MKTIILIIVCFCFLSANSFAKSIDAKTLFEFSKKNGYTDNQSTYKEEEKFSAYKGGDRSIVPFTSIEAYNGKTSFKTVALNCDACGLKEITKDQIVLCQSEFKNLYKGLFNKELSSKVASAIGSTDSSKEIANDAVETIKIYSGVLRCGGMRLQVSIC
ncbi:MAG: hypothetical protein H7256_03815 [Bdellovibrio sp.]|nr:hypothetical protein [Bdellovibrio sp.]